MKKLTSIIVFLLIGYVIPLLGKPELILHPFHILLMLSCIIVLITQPDSSKEEIQATKTTDQNSYWVIYGLASIGILAPTIEWAYFTAAPVTLNLASGIGLFLLISGLALRIWAIRTLGRFFTNTVQIQADHQLIQAGPYRLLRHPSYTGAYMAYLGSGLLLNAYCGLLITIVAMGIAYYYRVSVEEKALSANFGDQYVNYQALTYRMIPFVW